MAAPDFLIIGAQKGGTTWLRHHLRRHPDIFMPESEVHFFDKTHHFEKGKAWYESHFQMASSKQIVGEKTPEYLWTTCDGAEGHMAGSPRRIHELYPDVKLIATLRNPVNRAVSSLNHLIRTGRISPFHRVDDLLLGKKRALTDPHGVISKGFYFRQLQPYLECFDRDQLLILLFEEDIVRSPQQTLRRLYDFVGVPPAVENAGAKQKRGGHRLSLLGILLQHYLLPKEVVKVLDRPLPKTKLHPSPDGVLQLYDLYEDENEKLFDRLGRRPATWSRSTVPSHG